MTHETYKIQVSVSTKFVEIFLILPLGPQKLKYLLYDFLQRKFADLSSEKSTREIQRGAKLTDHS